MYHPKFKNVSSRKQKSMASSPKVVVPRRSPLAPVNKNLVLETVKKEPVSSPTNTVSKSKDRNGSNKENTGAQHQHHLDSDSVLFSDAMMAEMASMNSSSAPIFSMDALNDVLGDFLESDGTGQECSEVGQKFNFDEISTIEQNADSVAAALFHATQPQEEPCTSAAAMEFLNAMMQSATPKESTSSLPQMEHPLLETLISPESSSHCSSPIYTRIHQSYRKSGTGYEAGIGSSDSNPGSECSDSDFEFDGDSSLGSDDSSDSDFDADDSDSDFGARKRKGCGATGVMRKSHQRRGRGINKFLGGATRKQPYHHYKTAHGKDKADLFMGNNKPLGTRQISSHQLEAIAATMGSSPVTVNWLLQNYETSEGNSLPRALMYGHYLRHCAELRLDPVNAASFGKLIRSVFVGLTTRRLGTRGNSKYHYCGIRIKDTSTLLLEDPDLSKKTRTNGKRSKKTQILAMQGVGICGLGGNKELTLELDSGGKIDVKAVKKYLGTKCANFPEIAISEFYMPDGISYQDLMYFADLYKKHCWEILDAIETFRLNEVGQIWNRFWRERAPTNEEDPLGLSKGYILMLTRVPEVQFAVQNLDAFAYDQILSILMPNVIAQLPFQLMEEYHRFSLTLRPALCSALEDYDPTFVHQKLQLLDSFINELKSWISLNLSAQAARDSMQSPSSIAQLLSDLNRINFRSVLMDVKEYVNVDEMDINVHESLKRILSGPDSIEPWSVWLVGLVEQRIGMSCAMKAAQEGQSTVSAVIKECQDLSLRWLKYMSQLKLELLLRSSGSLATFLSLELLFSNFLLHLIKVYKSRALQVPLVLYSVLRRNGQSDYATMNTTGQQMMMREVIVNENLNLGTMKQEEEELGEENQQKKNNDFVEQPTLGVVKQEDMDDVEVVEEVSVIAH